MIYDASFFGWQADGSSTSAAVVAPVLDRMLHPESVLDVGCGLGTWASMWPHSLGVDGDWVPRAQLRLPPERFIPHDLSTPLDLHRRFDVVLCLEVVEHLPRIAGQVLIDSLCRHADIVVFSAAVPGQGGHGHVNERWPSHWAKRFARHGYRPYDLLRDHFWWDQRVEWWYRQNILIFATDASARRHGWEPASAPLDRVHPFRANLTATVCIPWRPSPSRLAAFDRVQEFWARTGWPVVTADSDTQVFSLAQARNNAVRKATTDVVVISDADTIPEMANVMTAVAHPTGVCWPFNRYRILSQEYLRTPYSELSAVPHINTWDGEGIAGVGGCLVATTKEYWRLGGQPPEFIGWGWEDTAFTYIVETLSSAKRVEGNIYAFEHNVRADKYTGGKADSPGWDRDIVRNQHVCSPYSAARGRPWIMRELLRRRDAGVSPPYIGYGHGSPTS